MYALAELFPAAAVEQADKAAFTGDGDLAGAPLPGVAAKTDAAEDRLRPALVDELLQVTTLSPLLPRVAAADAQLDGCPVRAGGRLILVARHAAQAHDRLPDARGWAAGRTPRDYAPVVPGG